MAKIKEGDFVEIDFIAKIKITDQIFDLTKADLAKKEGVFREGYEYKPLTICVGAGYVIPGLDDALKGKEIGKEFEIDIPPEKAFGKRNQKFIKLTPLSVFKKKNIQPVPGMQLNLDGRIATIRSVTGGRVILDFNPPLAGKELHYWVKPLKILEKPEDKARAVFKTLGFSAEGINFKEGTLTLNLKNKEKLGKQFLDLLEKEIKKRVKDVKKVTFK